MSLILNLPLLAKKVHSLVKTITDQTATIASLTARVAALETENESVFCFAQQTVIQSVPTGTTRRLVYSNITADTTHPSAFSGTAAGGVDTWLWTAPKAGNYLFIATHVLLGIPAAAESLMDIYINGTTLFRGGVLNANGTAGNNYKGCIASGTLRIAAGTTAYATVLHTSGGNRNTSSFWADGYFIATRLGS